VGFGVERHGPTQFASIVAQQDVAGLPAAIGADAAAALQAVEKGMAQERIAGGVQGVPLLGVDAAQVRKDVDLHDDILRPGRALVKDWEG